MSDLVNKHCTACEGGIQPLVGDDLKQYLQQIAAPWMVDATGKIISRTYHFNNFYETIAFVNALAWIANQEDHHPDLEVSYKQCKVHFSTHSIGGLSENDFICAAKVDALVE